MAKYHANNATEAKARYKNTTGLVPNTSGVKNLQILTNDSKSDSS